MALGAALVVLAGVLVAWALSRAADRVQVVQVARTVHAGDAITADDLTVTGVAFDDQVKGLVPASSLDRLAGRVAAVDLTPGSLLQVGMWRDSPRLGAGERSVGVVLKQGRYPSGLSSGDIALAVPLDPGTTTAAPIRVRVIAARATTEGNLSMTLAVPGADAVGVAQLAANERLILVGDTAEGAA
jgi:hypothetical protein